MGIKKARNWATFQLHESLFSVAKIGTIFELPKNLKHFFDFICCIEKMVLSLQVENRLILYRIGKA